MTLRLLLLVATLAFVEGGLGAQPGSQPAGTTIVLRGRVSSEDGGSVLRRARITVSPPDVEQPIFTDGRGAFQIRVRTGSTHTLAVTKAGFVTGSATVAAPARSDRAPGPIELRLQRAGVIAGRVLDPLGNPLRNVRVRARPLDTQSEPRRGQERATTTDDLGTYRLTGLMPGRYVVSPVLAERAPADAEYERRTAELQKLLADLAANDKARALALGKAFELPATPTEPQAAPQELIVTVESGKDVGVEHELSGQPRSEPSPVPTRGVVSGRVLDESGEPVEGLIVDLVRIGYVAGGRVLEAPVGSRSTGDSGQFRLFDIPPGAYMLEARDSGEGGSRPIYAPNFYPDGAALGEAQSLVVEAGRELDGLNITFTPVRTVTVRGMVFDSTRQPKVTGSVGIAAMNPWGTIALASDVRLAADGTFELPAVPPGEYVLHAVGKGSSGSREMGITTATITSSDTAVQITTVVGARVSGRIVFEGSPPSTKLSAFGLSVAPSDPAYAAMLSVYDGGFVGDDGRFEMTGVVGPGRLALATGPEGWWIKSVLVGGRDVTDTPVMFTDRIDLQVVLSSEGGRIEFRGAAAPEVFLNASVATFPIDQTLWFYRSRHLRLARPAMGRFGVSLPAGEYWVALVDSPYAETAFGSWGLDTLNVLAARARRVTVKAGETVVVDLGNSRPPN